MCNNKYYHQVIMMAMRREENLGGGNLKKKSRRSKVNTTVTWVSPRKLLFLSRGGRSSEKKASTVQKIFSESFSFPTDSGIILDKIEFFRKFFSKKFF